MRAADIMTMDPVCISPDASIAEAIRVMLQRKFSGLPVVDSAGALVGIVTEGDLLRRTEIGTQRKRSRWMEILLGPGRMATEYVHASGRKVREVMSPDVETATEDSPHRRNHMSGSVSGRQFVSPRGKHAGSETD